MNDLPLALTLATAMALVVLAFAWRACGAGVPSLSAIPGPPELRRELRGAWIATKGNIDWPTKPGLKVERQQRELVAQLDLAADIGLNAVILQEIGRAHV